jgi:hypothetical protein
MKKPAQPPAPSTPEKATNDALKNLLAPLKAAAQAPASKPPDKPPAPTPKLEKNARQRAESLDAGDALFLMVMEEIDRPSAKEARAGDVKRPAASGTAEAPAPKRFSADDLEALAQLAELVATGEPMRRQRDANGAERRWDPGVDSAIAARLQGGEFTPTHRAELPTATTADELLRQVTAARRAKQRLVELSWPEASATFDRMLTTTIERLLVAASLHAANGRQWLRLLVRH